jgi:hypothetical protein
MKTTFLHIQLFLLLNHFLLGHYSRYSLIFSIIFLNILGKVLIHSAIIVLLKFPQFDQAQCNTILYFEIIITFTFTPQFLRFLTNENLLKFLLQMFFYN